VRLSVAPVRARLRAPFAAAWGTTSERDLLVVRLEAADGTVGWGEAAPLPGYGGASVGDVRAALDAYGAALARVGEGPRNQLLAACAAASDLPEALAAVDLALWDREGRRCGQPVWQLLGGLWDITPDIAKRYPNPPAVTVNATVAAEDPLGVSAEVTAARAAGFRCVKVKVALGHDAARLAAARAAGGDEMAIRIDANGAWSVEEAVAALQELAPYGIELCEEPVHGLEGIAAMAAASPIPIALDETAAGPGALERRVCDAACLKIARSGGLTGLLERASQARVAGYRIYLASTLDGPLAIAAALHAAVAIRPELPSGLATLGVFADRPDPLPARGGRVSPPSGPGLGEGLRAWYGS
jgi:L-alanine-DL-glutamate epimerase-like enolase superfamily enzyme